MIQSTVQDFPLTITSLMEHGRKIHADAQILTYNGPGDIVTGSFAEVAEK